LTRVLTAALVTLVFALLARLIRGVTTSGAIAGAIVCFLLYAIAGPGAFAALVWVFVLAWITTRFGYKQKQKLGTAEKREGRTASQVLANLGTAAICAVFFSLSKNVAYLLAVCAALSEAAADTVSSELGQAFHQQARLITSGELVPAGTDGGVTLAGTMAGTLAAVVVTGVCAATGVIPRNWFGLSVLAGVAGMLFDSFLGALYERRHILNNDAVNFLSTVFSAVLAFTLSLYFH